MADQVSSELISMFSSLRRIGHAMEIQSRRIDRDFGLTLPQLFVLGCISDLGEGTSRAIAAAAHLSPPTVVLILDRLEAKGAITRTRSLTDRRTVQSRLTVKGAELLADAGPELLGARFRQGFAALSEAERAGLAQVLDQIATLMSEP